MEWIVLIVVFSSAFLWIAFQDTSDRYRCVHLKSSVSVRALRAKLAYEVSKNWEVELIALDMLRIQKLLPGISDTDYKKLQVIQKEFIELSEKLRLEEEKLGIEEEVSQRFLLLTS